MYIYRMYITKNGHRIYRKNHKPFRLWVDDNDDSDNDERKDA